MKILLIFTILYGTLPFIFYQIIKKNLTGLKEIYPFILTVLIASLYEFLGTIILKISFEKWYLIYKILAFLSLHYFFYYLLNKAYKFVFLLFCGVFGLLVVLTFSLWIDFNFLDLNSYFNIFQTIVVLTFSILWFRKMFRSLEVDNLLKNSNFYFISGLIIYYCGTVYLFLMSSTIYNIDKSNFQYYWLLNIILNLVLRSLLIIGIWKARVK
jgi:hypothetical protein